MYTDFEDNTKYIQLDGNAYRYVEEDPELFEKAKDYIYETLVDISGDPCNLYGFTQAYSDFHYIKDESTPVHIRVEMYPNIDEIEVYTSPNSYGESFKLSEYDEACDYIKKEYRARWAKAAKSDIKNLSCVETAEVVKDEGNLVEISGRLENGENFFISFELENNRKGASSSVTVDDKCKEFFAEERFYTTALDFLEDH